MPGTSRPKKYQGPRGFRALTPREEITVAGAEALAAQPNPMWEAVLLLDAACDGDREAIATRLPRLTRRETQ